MARDRTGGSHWAHVSPVAFRPCRFRDGLDWPSLFVNFVQINALEEADEASRSAISKWIVPNVAAGFRHASHLTVLSGGMLLVVTGYVLADWVYSTAAYIPLPRILTLVAGALGGLVMWVFVNFVIWPSLKIALELRAGRRSRQGPGATDSKALRAAQSHFGAARGVRYGRGSASYLI